MLRWEPEAGGGGTEMWPIDLMATGQAVVPVIMLMVADLLLYTIFLKLYGIRLKRLKNKLPKMCSCF